jgi:hypothetical protein
MVPGHAKKAGCIQLQNPVVGENSTAFGAYLKAKEKFKGQPAFKEKI